MGICAQRENGRRTPPLAPGFSAGSPGLAGRAVFPAWPHRPGAAAPAEEDTPAQIAIPGYEGLTLQAGAKKQSLRLPNPAENHCYFQISLYLADDTLLWQSDLIKPGKTSAPITLSRPLDPGTYPGATLRYACFRLDREKTPLNGARNEIDPLGSIKNEKEK